ncbi:MAG: methionyl-tRNA formyltransferase [Planctomycetota bacterium]|nr:methionyl-tRNA formyltransferase [Planctomycetota bacterium]
MRVAFLGSPPFATEVFAALVKGGIDIVGLVTAPPRRAGRGRKEVPNPLVEIAIAAGIPVLRPDSALNADFKASFAQWGAEVGVVASYGQILDAELLAIPRCGCLNLHGSLLPRWRGASPIQAALLAGDKESGVSVQRMALALDSGNVIAEKPLPIGPRETAPELFERLAKVGAKLVLEVVRAGAKQGDFPEGQPQDESAVTVCKRIHKKEGQLDWSSSATDVDRRVRAMAGWPCALTTLPDGTALKVHDGEPRNREVVSTSSDNTVADAEPGTILSLDDGISVVCGEDVFLITALQRQGKARLDSGEFLRGVALKVGDRLGMES